MTGPAEPVASWPAYDEPAATPAPPAPMTPALYRVVHLRRESQDVTTLALAPRAGPAISHLAGQFNMLTAFGVGEAAISISSSPHHAGSLQHTVRDVGPVTHALCNSAVGDVVGVRGPFGTHWGVDELAGEGSPDLVSRTAEGPAGGDVVVVGGGIGLAPLRGAVNQLVAAGQQRRVFVMVGARAPGQVIFGDDLDAWSRGGVHVEVTVDVADPGWRGNVGLVTSLLGRGGFDPRAATALVCGPAVMMRFTARALEDLGVDPQRIRVSLERNMQCGVGWCGHCQLGPFLLCRDGPVLPYAGEVAALLMERER